MSTSLFIVFVQHVIYPKFAVLDFYCHDPEIDIIKSFSFHNSGNNILQLNIMICNMHMQLGRDDDDNGCFQSNKQV